MTGDGKIVIARTALKTGDGERVTPLRSALSGLQRKKRKVPDEMGAAGAMGIDGEQHGTRRDAKRRAERIVIDGRDESIEKRAEQPVAHRVDRRPNPACSERRNEGVFHGGMLLYSRSFKKNSGRSSDFPGFCRPSHPDQIAAVALSANLVASLAASAGLQQRVLFRTHTGFPFKPACLHDGHHMFG